MSGAIALCIVLMLAFWPLPDYGPYQPATYVRVIATTWFGPLLVLTLPVLIVWMSFAAETHEGAAVGIGVSMLVFVLCLLFIWFAHGANGRYYGPYRTPGRNTQAGDAVVLRSTTATTPLLHPGPDATRRQDAFGQI